MLSFTSSLSPGSDAFVIFVTEKYVYTRMKRAILSSDYGSKNKFFSQRIKSKKRRRRYKFH